MNERIRDLKEQSLIWAIETLDPDALNDNEWGVAIDEKFAELIVKECAELCDRFQAREVGMQPTECAGAIRKMFGVEE
jgi:hypothetical protein